MKDVVVVLNTCKFEELTRAMDKVVTSGSEISQVEDAGIFEIEFKGLDKEVLKVVKNLAFKAGNQAYENFGRSFTEEWPVWKKIAWIAISNLEIIVSHCVIRLENQISNARYPAALTANVEMLSLIPTDKHSQKSFIPFSLYTYKAFHANGVNIGLNSLDLSLPMNLRATSESIKISGVDLEDDFVVDDKLTEESESIVCAKIPPILSLQNFSAKVGFLVISNAANENESLSFLLSKNVNSIVPNLLEKEPNILIDISISDVYLCLSELQKDYLFDFIHHFHSFLICTELSWMRPKHVYDPLVCNSSGKQCIPAPTRIKLLWQFACAAVLSQKNPRYKRMMWNLRILFCYMRIISLYFVRAPLKNWEKFQLDYISQIFPPDVIRQVQTVSIKKLLVHRGLNNCPNLLAVLSWYQILYANIFSFWVPALVNWNEFVRNSLKDAVISYFFEFIFNTTNPVHGFFSNVYEWVTSCCRRSNLKVQNVKRMRDFRDSQNEKPKTSLSTHNDATLINAVAFSLEIRQIVFCVITLILPSIVQP